MKKNLLLFLLLIIPISLFWGQQRPAYQRKNFVLKKGDTFSHSLIEKGGSVWELHIITKDMLSLTAKKRVNGRLRFSVRMKKLGLAKMEATLLQKKGKQLVIVKQINFFFKVTNKSQLPDNKTQRKTEDPKNKKQQESADARDFQFAFSIFKKGYYFEAANNFQIFRRKYSKSPFLARAYIYEGQAFFHLKQFRKALTRFTSALKTATGKVRYTAFLWQGYCNDQLKRDSAAVVSFLNALSAIAHPEIIIRARTGFALYYARRQKLQLADLQFTRIFSMKRDEKKLAYALALFKAGSFYDANGFISKAHKCYVKFVRVSKAHLMGRKLPYLLYRMLKRQKKIAKQRLDFLKKSFIDYH